MSMGRILIVEDDPEVVARIKPLLDAEGYEVAAESSGAAAVENARAHQPDLIVLDINLEPAPGDTTQPMDGIEVLRKIRAESDTCVLMLTETSLSYVKMAAFSLGADDYLTKPFDPKELVARAAAILRRAQGGSRSKDLAFGDLRIDRAARKVYKGEVPLNLTPIEFDLLCALTRRPGQVMSRSQLIGQAWDYRYSGDERLVDVHVGRLRKKIESDPAHPLFIITVWGRGYRFDTGET